MIDSEKIAAPKIKPEAIEQFIEAITASVRSGYGITPYTGAGISARSGIMVGSGFTNYLIWVIYRCLHAPDPARAGSVPHNIRSDGWPVAPTSADLLKIGKWVGDKFKAICKRHGLEVEYHSEGNYVHISDVAPIDVHRGPGDPVWTRPMLPRILRGCRNLTRQDEAIKRLLADKPITSYLDTPDDSRVRPDSDTGIVEVAIRSMFDWRAMLDFLTRLTLNQGKPVLRDRLTSVIDSFHQYIIFGRKPNLAHSMLAQLAGPLRTRVLITTNFDSLHEQSFGALGIPYERHDVTLAQGLPAVPTIRASTSIIKLHGSNTGTRADFSLDRAPTLEENDTFFHYVTGHSSLEPESDKKWVPSHLLVVGASGDDTRCLHLIKYLLDFGKEAKVFWVCYNKAELEKIRNYFLEPEYADRLVTTVTDRSDLLLLELYQNVTLTLPSGGFSYHYSHDVPPTLWNSSSGSPSFSDPVKTSISEAVESILVPRVDDAGIFGVICAVPAVREKYPKRRPVSVASKQCEDAVNLKIWRGTMLPEHALEYVRSLPANQGAKFENYASGLTPVVTQILNDLQARKKETIWLEMDEFADVPSLIHELFNIISLKLGVFQLEHAVLLPARMVDRRETALKNPEALAMMWQEVIRNAWRYLGGDFGRYVVCFYGRNVPGSCATWEDTGEVWNEEKYQELHLVLALLCKQKMDVLYVPLTPTRVRENQKKAEEVQEPSPEVPTETPKADLSEADGVQPDFIFKEGKSEAEVKRSPLFPPQIKIQTLKLIPHNDSERLGKLGGDPKGIVGVLKALRVKLKEQIPRPVSSEDPPLQDPPLEDSSPKDSPQLPNELRLLYAVSLFRHARPPSIFWTDPVFPSEHQFNAQGVDSDWMKSKEVAPWLQEYRLNELMLRKGGGNSWMYFDALKGLRTMLETSKDLAISGETSLIAFKSRTHFWIARWYFRAFCSSSHVTPLLESFYHFYQSIISLKEAVAPSKTPDPDVYALQRLVRGLSEWIKILRLCRPALLFWLDRPAVEAWFREDALKKIRGRISATIKALAPTPETPAADAYIDYAKKLVQILILELGRCRLDFRRIQSVPAELLYERTSDFDFESESLEFGKTHIFSKETDWVPDSKKARGKTLKEAEATTRAIIDRLLGKNSGLGVDAEVKEPELGPKVYKGIKKVALKSLKTEDDFASMLPYVLSILVEKIYLLVRVAKALDIGNDLKYVPPTITPSVIPASLDSLEKWKQVTVLGRLIIDLCAYCGPSLIAFDMEIRVSVLTLHGLALGRLGRFFQAHRRLNEAHALQTRLIARLGDPPDFAIIELRRAEVYLLEADQVATLRQAVDDVKNEAPARDGLEEVLENGFTSDEDGLWKKALAKYGVAIEGNDILRKQLIEIYGFHYPGNLGRILVAKLDDAWASIEVAEKLLSGQVKSSLSWGRLCNLKLRLFAHHSKSSTAGWELLALRRKQDLSSEQSKWLRLGFANWPDDPYRQLKLAWHYLRARANWPRTIGQKTVFEDKNRADEEDIELLLGLLDEWCYEKEEIFIVEEYRKRFYAIIGFAPPEIIDPKDPNYIDPKEALKKALGELKIGSLPTVLWEVEKPRDTVVAAQGS